MTKDEALRLALRAMESFQNRTNGLYEGEFEEEITAIKAALEAKDEETELEKDAVNLLFALHDAWPYVHQHCTIEAKKKSIQALIVKHGDFADLHPPPQRKPLTDEEMRDCLDEADQMYCERDGDKELFKGRAIEAAHGIKGEA